MPMDEAADPARCPTRRRRSRRCWAPCSSTPTASRTSWTSSSPRTSTCGRTGRSSRPSTPCSSTPSPSTASPWPEEMEQNGLYDRRHPGVSAPADGGHPHRRQRHGVCEHRPGQGPAAARWPQPAADITAMVQEGTGTAGRTFWRRRSRRSTPSARAAAPRSMAPIADGAAGRAGPAGGADRQRDASHARPVHRPFRRWTGKITGLNKSDLHAAGRPPRHGQDLLWP